MSNHYIVQSWRSAAYVDLFKRALDWGPYTRLDAAVAYATVGGVRAVERVFAEHPNGRWMNATKRWLVGIDWCRSDPAALRRLAALSDSRVRVPNGRSLLSRPGCTPVISYHPKLFVLQGIRRAAIICGSGNLSANGMMRGCECGSLQFIEWRARSPRPRGLRYLLEWFASAWECATPSSSMIDRYATLAKRSRRMPAGTELDEDSSLPAGRGLSRTQLKELRLYDRFWIDAGALGANLGSGRPGNQLDMPRYCRVFFGAPALDLPPDTEIDRLTLIWGRRRHSGCTLKFANNHMDKLNVPLPGARGSDFYAGKTLLFTRRDDGSFGFEAGDAAAAALWRRQSRSRTYRMSGASRRRWGLL